jgi:hypothetical protein
MMKPNLAIMTISLGKILENVNIRKGPVEKQVYFMLFSGLLIYPLKLYLIISQ